MKRQALHTTPTIAERMELAYSEESDSNLKDDNIVFDICSCVSVATMTEPLAVDQAAIQTTPLLVKCCSTMTPTTISKGVQANPVTRSVIGQTRSEPLACEPVKENIPYEPIKESVAIEPFQVLLSTMNTTFT